MEKQIHFMSTHDMFIYFADDKVEREYLSVNLEQQRSAKYNNLYQVSTFTTNIAQYMYVTVYVLTFKIEYTPRREIAVRVSGLHSVDRDSSVVF